VCRMGEPVPDRQVTWPLVGYFTEAGGPLTAPAYLPYVLCTGLNCLGWEASRMQRLTPASSVVLLSRIQVPAGRQKQVKLEALEQVSPWAEDIYQLRVAVSVGQPREVLTTLTVAGYLLPVNRNNS